MIRSLHSLTVTLFSSHQVIISDQRAASYACSSHAGHWGTASDIHQLLWALITWIDSLSTHSTEWGIHPHLSRDWTLASLVGRAHQLL